LIIYLVIRIRLFAHLITAEAVIPKNKFLIPDLPLVPITKKFFTFSTYMVISP